MPNPIEAGVQYAREALRGVRLPAPALRGVISNPMNYVRLTLAAGAGLVLSACDRPAIDPSTITQEPARPVATATISLTPGIGGGEPVPTFPAGHPRASENAAIEAANKRDADARATATVMAGEAQKPTPASEDKKESLSGILSPEAEATGKYVEWKRPDGQPLRGMGFILKPQDKISIPENLQVTATEYNQPSTYNGYLIKGFRKDGTLLAFITTATPAVAETMVVGTHLSAGTKVGVMESDETVFGNAPFNLIVLYPSAEELDRSSPNRARDPEVINNTPISNPVISPPIFNNP